MSTFLRLCGALLLWSVLFTVTAEFVYDISSLRPPVQDGLAASAAIGFAVLVVRIFFPKAVPLDCATRG